MLPLEFSYGRLSGEDLQNLELPLRNVVTRTRMLHHSFHEICNECYTSV
jgi:heterodisulfide reductase subunit B